MSHFFLYLKRVFVVLCKNNINITIHLFKRLSEKFYLCGRLQNAPT